MSDKRRTFVTLIEIFQNFFEGRNKILTWVMRETVKFEFVAVICSGLVEGQPKNFLSRRI